MKDVTKLPSKQQLCMLAGADPEIEEEGGTHTVGIGVAMRRAHSMRIFFSCFIFLCAYKAQCCRGVWEYAPPGKFSNLKHMRVLLGAVGDHHNHAKFMVTGL